MNSLCGIFRPKLNENSLKEFEASFSIPYEETYVVRHRKATDEAQIMAQQLDQLNHDLVNKQMNSNANYLEVTDTNGRSIEPMDLDYNAYINELINVN